MKRDQNQEEGKRLNDRSFHSQWHRQSKKDDRSDRLKAAALISWLDKIMGRDDDTSTERPEEPES